MTSHFSVAPLSHEVGLTLLEHLRADVQKKCERIGNNAPLLLGIDRTNKTAIYVQANCKMWDCAGCGARKASQWVARVIQGLKHYGGQWFFMTLTAHRYKRGAKDSLHNLRQGWSRLYDRLRRTYGAFLYIKVFEQHKDKSLHLHLLTDLRMPYRTTRKKDKKSGKVRDSYSCRALKNMCASVGIGYMADYQPLNSVGLSAWYVTKYLLKSVGNSDFPKGVRRIQANIGFPKLPDLRGDNAIDWVYIKSRTDMLLTTWNLYKYEGILTYDETLDKTVNSDDWNSILV